METQETTEAPQGPETPRPFPSSIRLSEPSRRSQAVTWAVLGAIAAALAVLVVLASTTGVSLWFTH